MWTSRRKHSGDGHHKGLVHYALALRFAGFAERLYRIAMAHGTRASRLRLFQMDYVVCRRGANSFNQYWPSLTTTIMARVRMLVHPSRFHLHRPVDVGIQSGLKFLSLHVRMFLASPYCLLGISSSTFLSNPAYESSPSILGVFALLTTWYNVLLASLWLSNSDANESSS